ncbi:MAG: DNA polymerase II, partial [Nanoarchaeota archaeon]
KDLLAGKFDDQLVYRKQIRKDLKEYTKTTPPHVKAARMLEANGVELQSNIIRYVMTVDGPQPVELAKSKLDYDHYIDKQLKPLADSILSFFDTDFDELRRNSSQRKLFGF